MTNAVINALRILSHFWLEEIQLNDLPAITALPELAETLPDTSPATLTELAIEYQRLFGFNLPPYESIFIDPSAMLQAPVTARVQALYRQAGWTPPANIRVGAPDHVGLELLALAQWLDKESRSRLKRDLTVELLTHPLHTSHLALWVPAFVLTLRRLEPHPFYAALADLTLDLLLDSFHANSQFPIHNSQFPIDPFPALPPPPVYDHQGRLIPLAERQPETGLRAIINHLLIPCQAGLFLTREEIARLSRQLNLPTVMGERTHMLETLFRLAGEYELVPALLEQLRQLLAQADAVYQSWSAEYPAWTPYAEAWRRRVAAALTILRVDKMVD